MSTKKLASILTVVAALGGTILVTRAHAQSLPSSAACIAACGVAQGDCASAAGQANQACVAQCASLRGQATGGCAQACANAVTAGIDACKATFGGCVASCSAD
jgi:hypothetical protein